MSFDHQITQKIGAGIKVSYEHVEKLHSLYQHDDPDFKQIPIFSEEVISKQTEIQQFKLHNSKSKKLIKRDYYIELVFGGKIKINYYADQILYDPIKRQKLEEYYVENV